MVQFPARLKPLFQQNLHSGGDAAAARDTPARAAQEGTAHQKGEPANKTLYRRNAESGK